MYLDEINKSNPGAYAEGYLTQGDFDRLSRESQEELLGQLELESPPQGRFGIVFAKDAEEVEIARAAGERLPQLCIKTDNANILAGEVWRAKTFRVSMWEGL